MRAWANPRVTTLECLAERESIYRQLAQTTPRNLSCEYHGYTLDPRTRCGRGKGRGALWCGVIV